MSMYLRFKRGNQTVFVHCEPTEKLQVVKERLSMLVGMDEDDVALYEYMTEERKQRVVAQMIERERERQKSVKKKNPYEQAPPPGSAGSTEKVIDESSIPPLDCEKKVWELGLESDAMVLYVYRMHDTGDEWEEAAADGLVAPKNPQRSTIVPPLHTHLLS